MSLHGILGYASVALAALAFIFNLDALRRRALASARAMFVCLAAGVIVQVPALASGVVVNAAGAVSAARLAPYNFFVAGSFFTLTCALTVWRGVNPGVVWDEDKWLSFAAGNLGNVLLGAALVALGRFSLAGA